MLNADLRIMNGRHEGKVISLTTKKFLVGRGDDCHMRPNNESVSRHHCVFTLDEYSVRLRDLGSTNGTFVNDEPIKGQVALNTGDHIRIGKLEFQVTVREQVAVPVDEMASEPEIPTELPGETIPTEAEAFYEEGTGTETMIDIPATANETQMLGDSETSFIPPPQQYPLQYAPGMMPPGYGYPPGQFPPGYPPMPGYPGYPPQMPGYPPQMPGYGYPPGQYPPGYPGGYPQMPGYGGGYPPQMVPPQPEAPIEEPEEEATPQKAKLDLDVKLPDPSETGVKEEPKPENSGENKGQSFAKENPSAKAQDI
ncbi:MAG: FHA domain-containing protein, partial [Planctomycetaceae bacterium]|nr:FHA domain-containing protein [Planctomycetaceae bacterium]